MHQRSYMGRHSQRLIKYDNLFSHSPFQHLSYIVVKLSLSLSLSVAEPVFKFHILTFFFFEAARKHKESSGSLHTQRH